MRDDSKCFMIQDLPAPIDANKWWWNIPVSNFPLKTSNTVTKNTTCQQAMEILKNTSNDDLILIGDQKQVKGIVTSNSLLTGLINGTIKECDLVEKALIKQFSKVGLSTTLGKVSHIFEKENNLVVVDDENDNVFVGTINQTSLFMFIRKGNTNVPQTNGSK